MNRYIAKLQSACPQWITESAIFGRSDIWSCWILAEGIYPVLKTLKDAFDFESFEILSITALHEHQFSMSYIISNTTDIFVVRTLLPLPYYQHHVISIYPLWPTAGFFERWITEKFGIQFQCAQPSLKVFPLFQGEYAD